MSEEPRGVVKDEHYAFAKGYYDGRVVGIDMNPYEHEDESRHWYRVGYDAGVSDYCKDENLD